jgi:hypothetical protein
VSSARRRTRVHGQPCRAPGRSYLPQTTRSAGIPRSGQSLRRPVRPTHPGPQWLQGWCTRNRAKPVRISEANQVALQAAGLSYILGTRIPFLPDVVREWRHKQPDEAVPDQLVLAQPWPATSSEKARGIPDRVVYYQFRHDRVRRTLRGIDEQVAKAEKAVIVGIAHAADEYATDTEFRGAVAAA